MRTSAKVADAAESLDLDAETVSFARAEREQLAKEAMARIKSGQTWADWMAVAACLQDGRQHALRESGANAPAGHHYSKAFSQWLEARPWLRELNHTTRNNAIWCADHAAKVEAWRATLDEDKRVTLNHPSSIKRAFAAAHRPKAVSAKPVRSTRIAQELEAALTRCDQLERRIESSERLAVDWRRDEPASIAHALATTLAFDRLRALHTAIGMEIALVEPAQ